VNNSLQIAILDDDQVIPWRTLSPPEISNRERRATLTDEWGNPRTYSYALENTPNLRAAGNHFTLIQLAEPDSVNQTFTWQNGLLTQINARLGPNGQGRNSTAIRYNNGVIQGISGGFLEIALDYTAEGRLTQARFADDTTIQVTYTENGLPQTYTDRQGAVYDLTYDENGFIAQRFRQNDRQLTVYTYNALGLVTSVNLDGHTITYTWDPLGRLIAIEDPILGTHTIRYQTDLISVIDASGVEQITQFDPLGRVNERRLQTEADPALRRVTYTYDVFDRLLSESEWISEEVAYTTRYEYLPMRELPAQPGDLVTTIHGYNVNVTDPYGRVTAYAYDREGRIRQIVDPLRKVTRMDYFTTETGNYTNGLRVVQREILASQVVTLTTYLFDLRYQLREVIQDKGDDRIRWIFNTGGDPVTINLLEATAADLRTVTWSDYRGARPTTIEVLPVPLTLNSGQRQPNLELSITSDFLGRPITRTDANGVTVQTAYCPRPNGALETRISQPNQVEPFGCDDGAIFAQATLTDIHGRLLSENTSDRGDQTYRTERDGQDWRITVSFGADQWALRYNPAGDLIEWVDESGHLHQYEYDRRGRLLRVTVPDQPEASLSFEYNAADLVTRQVDDLGRGTLYQYDPRGLLLVNQDLLTADATTYAYGAFGQMTSAISPLGASFTYRYDDPTDPLRLTGVIDPNGGAQTFTWNEVDNTLTYSDVRGNQTRYSFDAFGLLWRIDDAAGQSHELRYNANGDLSAIVTAQPNGRAAARNLTLTHEADGTLVITEPSVTDWSWRFRFDTQGDLIRITDPNRYELGITYDPLGRITGINGDEPYSWQIEYQPGESALLFNGTRLEYDSLMRLTRIVTADETETTYTYGVEDGAVTLDLDGANTRRYTFTTGDNASEPRTVTLTAPGHTVTYRYNPEGLIEEFRSEACTAADLSACETDQTLLWITAVTFAYDSQGRPVRIVDAEQNIETFVYDDVGNLIAYQTPNSKTYTYGYDRLGRLTALSSPTGIKLLLSYDPLDNVTGICRTRVEAPDDYTGCERAGGVIERYTYDPLGRLTAQTFPNSGSSTGQTTITHTYSAGWLTSWGTPERTITRVYEQNIFGLLERLDQSYRFSYDPMRRIISETGETYAYSYAYDPFGRVIQLDQDTPITYQPDGRGYTVADLAHTLNEAGFLSALRYGLSEDLPGMAINYILTARDPNVLSVVLSADDGTRGLDAQFDRRGVPLSAFFTYGDHRLLIDYVTNPNGAIARQRITGRPAVPFEQGAGGYIMVTGYDDDERPTTLRITDNASGALLYTVSFTYNGVGQRETENRRYADGAQVNIRYEYGETAQLTRQLIEVIPVTQAISLLFLAPLLFWLRQRRGRFALLILLVGGVLWFATITAQTNSLTLEYRYDSVGNLSQVVSASGVCREYRYDALGRVTAISGEQVFVYDATGRLIGQNGNQIRYTGDHPYQIETDGRPSAPGRIAGMPPLWTATEGAGVIWNITDMRAQILTTEVSETPLRLYDPLGRRIQFTLPAFADDPCVLHGFEGLTFTPTGRAYDPTIGLYLQRGPIDVFGGAYTAQGQRDLPIQTSEGLQLARGLQVLGQAYQTTRLSQNLDASVIRARYLPQAPKTDLWIEDLGGDSAIRDSLETLLTLPYWLNTEFNLAGGAIDPQSGAITLGNESQLGVASRAIHETPIARLLQFTETGIALPISYQPLTGTMHNPLARTWQPITPQFAFFDRVLMRLPRPLIAPEQALTTLNAVEKVIDLANQTGGDWADQLLEGALPIRPETILPPLNAETWRSKWFSTDTFGLGTVLGERLEVPNQPHLPLYRLAWNEDWLFPSSR
jgi:YD repeat-containing protein